MKLWSMRSLIAIGLSIAAGIFLYGFVSRSPYFLGVVLIGGIYLAGVSTMKAGAVYGAVISFPLGLFFAVTNTLGPDVAKNGLGSLLIIVLVAGFGAVYGAALIWVKQKILEGTSFNQIGELRPALPGVPATLAQVRKKFNIPAMRPA